MKNNEPQGVAPAVKGQEDLFNEKEEFFDALSFVPTDEHCKGLKDFYNVVRKKKFDRTYNPIKLTISYLVKQPKFGWVETKDLQKHFKKLFSSFELAEADIENDPVNFSISLGRNIGLLYFGADRCSTVTHISALIYRTLEAKLVPHPREFLEAFLDQVQLSFRLAFYVLNFQNFFKCSEEVVKAIQKSAKESDEETKNEFLNLYEVFLGLNMDASKDSKAKLIKNVFKSAGKTGLTYGAMFAIYYASTFIQMDSTFRWAMDNAVLYEMNVMISELTRSFRQIKDQEYISEIQSALAGKGTNNLQTKDNLNIGNRLVQQEHVASECMECRLRAQLDSKGGSQVRLVI